MLTVSVGADHLAEPVSLCPMQSGAQSGPFPKVLLVPNQLCRRIRGNISRLVRGTIVDDEDGWRHGQQLALRAEVANDGTDVVLRLVGRDDDKGQQSAGRLAAMGHRRMSVS